MQHFYKFRPGWLLGIGLVGALVHLWASINGALFVVIASKLVPVSCMMAWVAGVSGRYARLILIGLGLSLLGDLLLAIPADLFIFGLLAFLCAHLCYVAAFLHTSKRLKPILLLPLLLWLGGVYSILYLKLGALAIPVAVYVLVIGSMLWRAFATLERPFRPWQWAAAGGALMFGLSDSVLAINRFHTPFSSAGTIVMLTYWAGQWGIARSVRR